MSRVAGFFLHFYQPPREDPWLGLVPIEWSAWPYHDWNERITTECYRALAAVALPKDSDGGIELSQPLTTSSFDVGPTLHHWLEEHASDVDRAVGFQVREVAHAPSSVALAAPLVHAILPLARPVDRALLVRWGIADYERRFSEKPLGMWLPETAVDVATLRILCDEGIRYTVLMPGQAARVRPNGGEWHDVNEHTLDTSRPYWIDLGDGRTMTIVFGHRDLSQRVAFGDLLADGTKLADEMVEQLSDSEDAIVLLVADGETYGHHHRFGDIGLAWALRHLERHHQVATALGEWIATQEPTWEVELAAVSAWSCAHGVERWRSDCGCTTGSSDGWNQRWRAPLREALDWLRDELVAAIDVTLAPMVDAVDTTLMEYGGVIAGTVSPEDFVTAHAPGSTHEAERTTVLEACEVYRNVLLSFTSCAWFFADPADIETSIVLRYAAVAIEGARRSLGIDSTDGFLARLSLVQSNRRGVDGDVLWRRVDDGVHYDEQVVAAGYAAELLTRGANARLRRGYWRTRVVEPREGDGEDTVRVAATHRLTLRGCEVLTRSRRLGGLGVRIEVRTDADDDGAWRSYGLSDLGADVVARVAASILIEAGSTDYERAIELLVVELLMRPIEHDDAVSLVALASAPRSLTPAGEASIRRALLAIVGRGDGAVEMNSLTALAMAVGLAELVEPDGGPGGAN